MKDKKTILITGSSRGIGRAIAELAYQQGYNVIVHGMTDSKELEEVHSKLKGSIKLSFDISNLKDVRSALEGVEVDILINNAGIARNFLSKIEDLDNGKALEEYKTNVLGTLNVTRALLPGMVKRGYGSVVNIASIKGRSNLSTLSTLTFGGTKAAIISLTKSLAKVYSPMGVRFNVVSPGYVETDQVKDWNDDTFKRINEGTILGRMASPEEIAETVMFIASNKASYMVGSEVLIDGGYEIKGK